MTNPIGAGTQNLVVNVPREEHKQIGKLALALSQSVGVLMRRLSLKGLEAELAQVEAQLHREIGFVAKDGELLLIRRAEALRQTVRSIRSTRERYYGVVMSQVFVLMFQLVPK